jgi:hypothetical protein
MTLLPRLYHNSCFIMPRKQVRYSADDTRKAQGSTKDASKGGLEWMGHHGGLRRPSNLMKRLFLLLQEPWLQPTLSPTQLTKLHLLLPRVSGRHRCHMLLLLLYNHRQSSTICHWIQSWTIPFIFASVPVLLCSTSLYSYIFYTYSWFQDCWIRGSAWFQLQIFYFIFSTVQSCPFTAREIFRRRASLMHESYSIRNDIEIVAIDWISSLTHYRMKSCVLHLKVARSLVLPWGSPMVSLSPLQLASPRGLLSDESFGRTSLASLNIKFTHYRLKICASNFGVVTKQSSSYP